jgi:lysosomal acid lipase/cholesteryl ester hydrolase
LSAVIPNPLDRLPGLQDRHFDPTMKSSLSSTLISATTSFLPTSPTRPKSSLAPLPGAPLSDDPSLIPAKYVSEKRDEDEGASSIPGITFSASQSRANASSVNPHPTRPGVATVRAPPSQLLDAPARAAMNMPNAATSHGQARAVRGGEAKTPEYEIEEDGIGGLSLSGSMYGVTNAAAGAGAGAGMESTPLLSPMPRYPGQAGGASSSRPSSAQSNSSGRGILRRIFIDRATTPSQHLTRPTFPPPSLSTYQPQPPSPLTFLAKVNLFIDQTISVLLSTFFLSFVVAWALSAELAKGLPKWVWPDRPRKFPWDDEKYWRKEGKAVSKDPKDYARQVGMDIEDQTVETEDGYFLRCVQQLTLPATSRLTALAECTESSTQSISPRLTDEVSDKHPLAVLMPDSS